MWSNIKKFIWPKFIESIPDLLSPTSQRSSAKLTPRLNSEAVLSNEASLISLRTSRAPRIRPIMPFETPFETGPCEIESILVSRSRLQDVELLLLLLKLCCGCCCCARQKLSVHVTSPQLKLFSNVELDRFEGEAASFSRPSGGIRSRFRDCFPPFPVDDFRFDEFRRDRFSPSPSSRWSRPGN